MIHDLDASLRVLVRRDAINGNDVEVAFDAPTREWAGKRSTPTINMYLFDIREDVARRRVEPERVLDDEGAVIGRRRPPRRYRLSYLVTAWTQRPEDEHRLLSSVLGAFLPHEELPRDVLEGSLAGQTSAIHLTIGLPPPPERSIGEIWSAMGGELKPSLELVLSAPFVLDELRHAGPPVTEEPRLTLGDDSGRRETAPSRGRRPFPGPRSPDSSPNRFERILGLATNDGAPGEDGDATGEGEESGSPAKTGRAGASSKGKAARAGGSKKRGSKQDAGDGTAPDRDDDDRARGPNAEETITGGKEGGPGRVFTIASTDPDRMITVSASVPAANLRSTGRSHG